MDNGSGGLSIGGIVSGADMLDEFVSERRFGKGTADGAATTFGDQPPAAAAPNNAEIEALKQQLAQMNNNFGELKSKYDQTQGSYQTLLQQLNAANRPQAQPMQLPQVETDDPDLAAALNTVEARMEAKLNQAVGRTMQEQQNLVRGLASQRFVNAVESMQSKHPDFKELFTPQQLQQFASPFINNPSYANLDWEKELGLVYKAHSYDRLQQKLAEAESKLTDYDKRQNREREAQKANLKLVPGSLGGRGTGSSNSAPGSLGEQILAEARAKGNRRNLTFKQFGNELRKRLSARA